MGATHIPHLSLERRNMFYLDFALGIERIIADILFLLLVQGNPSPRPSLAGSSAQTKPKKWFLVDPPFG